MGPVVTKILCYSGSRRPRQHDKQRDFSLSVVYFSSSLHFHRNHTTHFLHTFFVAYLLHVFIVVENNDICGGEGERKHAMGTNN